MAAHFSLLRCLGKGTVFQCSDNHDLIVFGERKCAKLFKHKYGEKTLLNDLCYISEYKRLFVFVFLTFPKQPLQSKNFGGIML